MLSNKQKSYLSQLARRAWQKLGPELDGQSAEDFRHERVARACGKYGLRCCGQGDYKLVEAYFLDLLGNAAGAQRSREAAATEGRRQAMAVLHRECVHAGIDIAYAEKIGRAQNHGRSLAELTDRRIWCLVFTVRNRAKARRITVAAPEPELVPSAT